MLSIALCRFVVLRAVAMTIVVGGLLLVLPETTNAGDISIANAPETGWKIYMLSQGKTVVRVAPDAGCNAFSVKHDGVEYFRVPEDLSKLPGVGFGNPILYPTPNRVRGAEFQFSGKTFSFPKNGRGNFIHGLVHRESFDVESVVTDANSAKIVCSLSFAPGTERFERFPIAHVFRMTITVSDGKVKWEYEVQNFDTEQSVPFGVGLHPYLVYHGARQSAQLRVPATHLMEAKRQLPSGELLSLDGHALDCRQFRTMDGIEADDVFYGMNPTSPAVVEFENAESSSRRVTFRASKEFTHLVVWTPDRPYFSVENQTCSTDAHNLASEGKADVAHLQVCPPGQRLRGEVEYEFE